MESVAIAVPTLDKGGLASHCLETHDQSSPHSGVYRTSSDGSQLSSEDASSQGGSFILTADLLEEFAEVNIESPSSLYVTAADSFGGLSLAEAMPRHTIRLERERNAALAKNEPRQAPRRTFEQQPSLESMLVPHKSILEKEKEAAMAADAPRKAPLRVIESQPSLDSVLVRHKSKLELAKEAAVAENAPRRAPVRAVEQQPPLESMLRKSYSLVEREQRAALIAAVENISPTASSSSSSDAFGGVLPPRRSRLQMEKEAAARLQAAGKAKIVAAEEAAEAAAVAAAEAQIAAGEEQSLKVDVGVPGSPNSSVSETVESPDCLSSFD